MPEIAGKAYVTLVYTNPRCLEALRLVARTLEDVAEDMPWQEDAKRAVRACRYMMRHLGAIVTTENPEGEKG